MRWSVFKDTLRFSIGMTLIWGIGLGALMTLSVNITPALQGVRTHRTVREFPATNAGSLRAGRRYIGLSNTGGLDCLRDFQQDGADFRGLSCRDGFTGHD